MEAEEEAPEVEEEEEEGQEEEGHEEEEAAAVEADPPFGLPPRVEACSLVAELGGLWGGRVREARKWHRLMRPL
jgi:hypothetical protein